jgi:hypothetical protein
LEKSRVSLRGRSPAPNRRWLALAFGRSPLVELYEWTLGHVDPRDVVLADMGTSFHAIMAAGRKVVALYDLFSNPYVDAATRARDAGAMLDPIRGARFAEFRYGATVYQVRYLAYPAKERTEIDAHVDAPLHRVFSTSNPVEGFDVYEVHADGIRPGASTAPDSTSPSAAPPPWARCRGGAGEGRTGLTARPLCVRETAATRRHPSNGLADSFRCYPP